MSPSSMAGQACSRCLQAELGVACDRASLAYQGSVAAAGLLPCTQQQPVGWASCRPSPTKLSPTLRRARTWPDQAGRSIKARLCALHHEWRQAAHTHYTLA